MSVFKSLVKKEKDPTEKKSKPSVFESLQTSDLEKNSDSTIDPRKLVVEHFLEEDDLQRQIERAQAMAMQGLIEGGVGLFGNLASAANQLTGENLPKLRIASKVLPTSEKIREFGEKATLGYTKPKNEFEESAKEFMGDIGASLPFAGVGRIPGTGSKLFDTARLWQPILTPLIGQSAKQIAKSFGSSEKSGDHWRIGSMILFDTLINKGKGSKSYINHLFDSAEKSTPSGAKTIASNLRKELLKLKVDLKKGGTSPDKTAALTKIGEALKLMIRKNGRFYIEIAQFPAFRKSINAIRSQLNSWKSELPPGVKKQAVRNLENVKSKFIDAGMEYGKKYNPDFYKYWSAANEAAFISNKSHFATKFMEKVLGKKLVSTLLGGSALGHTIGSVVSGNSAIPALAKGAVATGGGALIGATAYGIGKMIYQMSKSPVLRKYYSNLFSAAAKQNGPRVAKYASKIKKENQKEKHNENRLIKSINRS